MRFTALLLLALTVLSSTAQQSHEEVVQLVRHATHTTAEPTIATPLKRGEASATQVIAVVFPTQDSAQLVVMERNQAEELHIAASSKVFYWPNPNYNVFIAGLDTVGSDRFALRLAVREGCARGLRIHRFALRDGTWMVVGRDSTTPKCMDSGIETDWAESSNYLTGKSEKSIFKNGQPNEVVRTKAPRAAFPLSEFPPATPNDDYEELQ